MMLLLSAVLCGLSSVTPLSVSALNPDSSVAALTTMQRRFDGLTDLSAEFERTLQWKLTGKSQTFKGNLTLKKPDMFRFEADGQVVSTDGKSVYNYAKANRQVVINRYVAPDQDRSPEGLLFNLLFRGSYVRDYVAREAGKEKAEGKVCQVVGLTARKEGAAIASIRLWVDTRTGFPARIEHTDFNSDVTVYRLWGFRPDRKVPDEAFRFVPPAGVEVVDLR